MSAAAATPFDSTHFRSVFAQLPTSVVIITGVTTGGAPLGITIGSFASISLDPPLAGFYIGNSSRTWPLIAAAGKFCANVLASDQAELCWRFAKDGVDGSRFDGLQPSTSPNGSPVLPSVVATIDCTLHATHHVGDHDLVVGAVTHLAATSSTVSSMVFYKGKVGDARIDS